MKNILILSAIFFASTAYAAIEVQVDQVKTPGTMSPTPGSMNTNPTLSIPKPADVNTPGATGTKPVDVPPNGESEPFIKDHDLSKAIYDAIRSDRLFAKDSKITIEVNVYNGKVTLSGSVKSQAEKERAEFLATQVNNLKKVTNDIKIAR